MSEAMTAAPCLTTAPLGPASAVIAADLAPNADYDLLLVASPLAAPSSDEALVARAHFHTSRYRNAHELLTALGLTAPDTYPILPHDAVLDQSVALPTSAQAPSDDALESALRDLGLDPWPLPSAPRTVLLWCPDGAGAFELAGVLLETDEPLLRPVDLTAVQAAVGSLALVAVRQCSRHARAARRDPRARPRQRGRSADRHAQRESRRMGGRPSSGRRATSGLSGDRMSSLAPRSLLAAQAIDHVGDPQLAARRAPARTAERAARPACGTAARLPTQPGTQRAVRGASLGHHLARQPRTGARSTVLGQP